MEFNFKLSHLLSLFFSNTLRLAKILIMTIYILFKNEIIVNSCF